MFTKMNSPAPPRPAPAADGPRRLADNVRRIRRRRGLTLDIVSQQSNLSKGFLSRLESGRANPTLHSLLALAEALETNIAHLLADSDDETEAEAPTARPSAIPLGPTLRPARPLVAWRPDAGRTYQLTPPGKRPFRVLMVDGAPKDHDTLVSHPGEEFCFVVTGRLVVDVNGQTYRLGPGDALHYAATVPHRFSSGTPNVPTRILVVT